MLQGMLAKEQARRQHSEAARLELEGKFWDLLDRFQMLQQALMSR